MNRGSLLQRWPGSRAALSVTATYPYFTWATVDLNFATNYGYQSGTVTTAAALITTTRASTAWAANAAGVYSSFSSNTPRITDLGLLTEEARTNSIRNNSMQGAAVGTPGTLPTNWSNAALSGLALNVTGTGTENGMDYIEFRLVGTSSGSGSAQIYFDTTTAITATNGQAWTSSAFVRLAAGSWANVSGGGPRLEIWELTSGGSYVTEGDSAVFTGIGSTYQRLTYAYTLVGGGTVARARPLINLIYVNGVAIDVTFRIAWPQFELGAFVTSPIRTTTVAVARAMDVVSLTTTPSLTDTYTSWANASFSEVSGTRYSLAGTSSQRMGYTTAGSGAAASLVFNGATTLNSAAGSGTWITGGKFAFGASATGRSIVFNNGTVSSDANTQSFPTTLYVAGPLGSVSGVVTTARFAIGSTRLDNNTLKAITA